MNYESPALAVDVIVLMPNYEKSLGIVLIKRKNHPLGCALPGGFVDVGETTRTAAIREVKEELNMDVELVNLLGVYDEPDRDPRKHVVSVAFLAMPVDASAKPVAGDDAKEAFIWKVDDEMPSLVCDHEKIIREVIDHLPELPGIPA